MSADGAAVVSGVDLALVSWMDGPVLDLSAAVSTQQRRHHQQRVGRCLCANDAASTTLKSDEPRAPILKQTNKKEQHQQHIVPQVVQLESARPKEEQSGPSNNGGPLPIKPILSRKNWSNTTETSIATSSGTQQSIQRHEPSCLRRYDSQQSCKSAVTLRSYISTQSRGECRNPQPLSPTLINLGTFISPSP